jgi:hypothetical protein
VERRQSEEKSERKKKRENERKKIRIVTMTIGENRKCENVF